jgi:hypothetical protein
MKNIRIAGMSALIVVMAIGAVSAAGIEDRGKYPAKHDSNTLHKIGNAIQYPFRKAGENVSKTTHQATNQNSVEKDQMRGSTEVVKPNGKTVVIAKDNPRIGWSSSHSKFMHRRNFNQEGRKYYWFGGHRYYRDAETGARIKID